MLCHWVDKTMLKPIYLSPLMIRALKVTFAKGFEPKARSLEVLSFAIKFLWLPFFCMSWHLGTSSLKTHINLSYITTFKGARALCHLVLDGLGPKIRNYGWDTHTPWKNKKNKKIRGKHFGIKGYIHYSSSLTPFTVKICNYQWEFSTILENTFQLHLTFLVA